MRGSLVVAMLLAGCGDNILPAGPPLTTAAALTIVAHQDDDLLFMQPELYDAVLRGAGVTNVYVTAGNGKDGIATAERRYEGLMEAYAHIAGAQRDDFACGWIEVAGHAAEHCRLDAAQVSLLFLAYPDGGKDGEETPSLLHLWEGKIDHATTVARRTTVYDQAALIATLADVIDTTQPTLVRTLELASTHGRDHADHRIVGALALLATEASHLHPELMWFRGYAIDGEPVNADPTLYDRSADALLRYAACAEGCAACGKACPQLDGEHDAWLHRHYAVGMRPTIDGVLQLGTQCITTPKPSANASFGDCATAPTWHVDANANLVASTGLCLEVLPTGEVIAAVACGPGPPRQFALDDEGHIWSGVPPAAQDDLETEHALCLANAGGRPRAVPCGAGGAPTWQVPRALASSPSTLQRTGRGVRLGDRGLCEIDGGQLVCAAIAADGTLAPAAVVAPLAIEPESLTLGDVDGDHRDDACGRDATGIVCATAASGFHAAPWTPLFAASGPATALDRSLSIASGRVCALTAAGIACAARGATTPDLRAPVGDAQAAAWAADLDGDGDPDWCLAGVAGIAGPTCGLAADRAASTDAVPWGYAFGGVVETAAPTADLGALADVDGDGRADLCTVAAGAITCARSLGHGFGPAVTIATLPAGMAPTGLWAAGSRICAGDASRIVCTQSTARP